MSELTKIIVIAAVMFSVIFSGCMVLVNYGNQRAAEKYQDLGVDVTASDLFWGVNVRVNVIECDANDE